MKYRVRYLHQNTGEIARFYPTTKADALEIAQQLIFDGEKDVLIEDQDGAVFAVESLSGRQRSEN